MVQDFFDSISAFPLGVVIGLITVYQRMLSPDHGPLRHLWTVGYCRHEPTCSQYAIEVLRSKGLVIGSLLAIKRILTCNPFTRPSDEKLHSLAVQELHR